MPVRNATAVWKGTLKEGSGTLKLGSGVFEGPYNYVSRFEEGDQTNPEELIGAALSGCFSMFLSSVLSKANYPPNRVQTVAKVHLGGGAINLIELNTEADVPNVDEATFMQHVEESKKNCPVSKALASVEVKVNAKLL